MYRIYLETDTENFMMTTSLVRHIKKTERKGGTMPSFKASPKEECSFIVFRGLNCVIHA